jgi:4-alpha-glucanotransferase
MSTAGASVPPFPPGYRASGVLLHVTSLPSSYGIGDLWPAAFAWLDRLHDAGQCWWQALPVGPTGYGDSPYQSLSSFAGNELLISPDGLIEDGLLQAADCARETFSSCVVEYERVVPFKIRLLEMAWSRFSAEARPDLRPAYEQFCHAHALWLDDYALFRALKARYNGACYLDWPVALVRRTPAALARARRELANRIEVVRFAQFLLSHQAQRLEQHAHDRGVRLIGDLPFFVSPDSSDVWANPDLFLLGTDHRPTVVAGVPPDYFSADGQLWGNPLYDWDALRHRGYRWCLERLRALLAQVNVIRLDHFRAVRSRLARTGGSLDGARGPVGPRPGRRVLPGRRKGVGHPALHRRGPRAHHAGRDCAA